MDLVSVLKEMVAINSVYPKEQRLAEYIENFLRKIDFSVERVGVSEGRFNLVAQNIPSSRYLGFYGHMDTVPAHPGYVDDPFDVVAERDTLRGLGVADMKGGIAAILQLAVFAQEKQLPVALFFGVDEENISRGAHSLVASGKMRSVSFLVSAESGQVTSATPAFAVNYGRKGNVVFDITSHGRTVHAAESEKGVNAIEQMALFISGMRELQFPEHAILGRTRFVIRQISGGIDSFSVPDSCRAVCNFLTVPGTTSEGLRLQLEQLAVRLHIDLSVSLAKRDTPYAEAYEVDTSDQFLQLCEEQVFSKYGVSTQYASSVADENVFAHRLHIPVISVGPVGGGDHTEHEWVSVASLYKTFDCYCDMLRLFSALPIDL